MNRIKYTSHAGLLTVIFAAILVFAYLTVMHHDHVWDLTRSRENTLDARTVSILDDLDFSVHIRVFDNEGSEREASERLLERYARASAKVTYDFVDPDARPGEARRAGIERYGQTLVEGGDHQERLERVDEEKLTNAFLGLMRPTEKHVYLLYGHGEPRIGDTGREGLSAFAQALEKDNYTVHELLLIRERGVPADAGCVVVAGPVKALQVEEIQALDAYLQRGGSLLVGLEPGQNAGLGDLLLSWGVQLDDDLVIDTFSRMLGGDYTVPVVSEYGSVSAVAGFPYATIFPTARSLRMVPDVGASLAVDWVVRTSENSWAEHDLGVWEEKGEASLDEHDRKGPLNLALYARKALTEDQTARLLAFGDAGFLNNNYLGVSGNRDLVMNCLNMLMGESSLIVIEPRVESDAPFILTPSQSRMVFLVTVVLLPAIILICGITVYVVRRRV